jgi:hypothetical protein
LDALEGDHQDVTSYEALLWGSILNIPRQRKEACKHIFYLEKTNHALANQGGMINLKIVKTSSRRHLAISFNYSINCLRLIYLRYLISNKKTNGQLYQ